MRIAINGDVESTNIRSNSQQTGLSVQREGCRIVFQFGNLTQDLVEPENGRERTPLKHFIEHLQGILKIGWLGVSGFVWI
jgi:hypothetical protein